MSIEILSVYSTTLVDLEEPDELSRKLRRADDFIRLAVVGAYQVLKSVADMKDEHQERIGIVLGCGFGTMQTNFEVLDQVVNKEPTSPTLFSHSVFNAGVGYIASLFNIRGCGLTLTDFSFPFFNALQQGISVLREGELQYCLVLQVETYSHLLEDIRSQQSNNNETWVPGVVCWLLTKDQGRDDLGSPPGDRYTVGELLLNYKDHDPMELFHSQEKWMINEKSYEKSYDPLQVAMSLTQSILSRSKDESDIFCTIDSVLGEVCLNLEKLGTIEHSTTRSK